MATKLKNSLNKLASIKKRAIDDNEMDLNAKQQHYGDAQSEADNSSLIRILKSLQKFQPGKDFTQENNAGEYYAGTKMLEEKERQAREKNAPPKPNGFFESPEAAYLGGAGAGGAVGTTVGSLVGDPKNRIRNAIIGGGAGVATGLAGTAAYRSRDDIKKLIESLVSKA